MTVDSLPDAPNLEQLKHHAKGLRDLVRGSAPGAIDLVRDHHPRLAELTAGSDSARSFKLADAQLTIARHYGFAGWTKLVRHVELIQRLTRAPHDQPIGGPLLDDDARADELLRLACLNYGADDPARVEQARVLIAEHAHLARHSVHTAAAVGDVRALRQLLVAHPERASMQGGPFAWEPILYLTYSRLDSPDPEHDPVAAAHVLLEHGADPNVGYLWEGLIPPFTALTGVFGKGEQGQGPHHDEMALAEVLLDAGADPNDSQTVYNRGLGDLASDDTQFLELLLAYGFGRGRGGPWFRRLAPDYPSPSELRQEALAHAAEADLSRRTALLLAHGADPNGKGLHPAFGGRTAYQGAVLRGNVEVAGLLLAAGGDASSIDPLGRFIGGCLAGDRRAVEAQLVADPTLLPRALEQDPQLVAIAAELNRSDAVRLLVDHGCDVNARHRTTALHEAALRGNFPMVRLLVELGADATIRDTSYDSTPSGWADHGGHADVAAYLANLER